MTFPMAFDRKHRVGSNRRRRGRSRFYVCICETFATQQYSLPLR